MLSEFRSRVIDGGLEQRLLEAARATGLIKPGGRQRSDSTHVLAATRELNQLEFIRETLRAALNHIAFVAADWLIGTVSQQ